MLMIPKKIHYCWFGGNPLPESAHKCIDSWKKFLPDYEIFQWDESNYDVNKIPYIAEAYKCKKYAFVSDYARFDILYQHGGLYFDTDVEVIRSFDDIIASGPFMGFEKRRDSQNGGLGVNPGLGFGVNPGLGLYSEILDIYSHLHFIKDDGSYNLKTIVRYTTDLLISKGLILDNTLQTVAGVTIYPWDYFCPIAYLSSKLEITKNTRSIHHYTATWVSPYIKLKIKISQLMGSILTNAIVSIKQFIKRKS